MTDDFDQPKFELDLSPETEFLIDGLVREGKFGSVTEALLLAVELGVQQLAKGAGFDALSPDSDD